MVDVAEVKRLLNKHFKCTGKVLIDDVTGVVSCTGSVQFKPSAYNALKHLPVKFDKIANNFNVGIGTLTSLKGAPTWVGRDFNCSNNQITALAHAPTHVGGDFLCRGNQLTNLAGAPVSVGGSFDCSNNNLTSLVHAPHQVGGYFSCGFNQLTTLEHAPARVSHLYCMENKLMSLQGAPRVINGELRCWDNNFQSLDGAPEEINGPIWMDYPSPHLPLLRILAIKGVTRIKLGMETNTLQDIINPYVGQGKPGALKAAADMIRAGYKDNARW